MSDTALLVLMNSGVQILLFSVAAGLAVLLARQLLKEMNLRSDAVLSSDDDEPLPAFPAFSVLLKVVILSALLMAAFSANVWLPKNDTSAPAVNSTMQGQIYRDAEEKREIVPAVTPTHEKNDAERADRVREIREQFDSLPDAE